LFDDVIRQGRVQAFDSQIAVDGVERPVRIAFAPIRHGLALDGVMLVITA
jgi:hypothetical protein